jgi:hypothetical protein
MKMNKLISNIVLIIGIFTMGFQCHKEEDNSSKQCNTFVACTKELRSVEITLQDLSMQPQTVDILEVKKGNTVIRKFDNISGQLVFNIVDDLMLGKELPKGASYDIELIGTQKGNKRFTRNYKISTDCCHVMYESGDLIIQF